MKIVASTGRDDIARAYVAETADGRLVEFTEALQPPLPREAKWVLVVSSLFGCPARCAICDAGGDYQGRLSLDEILAQIDFLVDRRYPGRRVTSEKFKIQFARVGEPTFNPAVLYALEELPRRYDAPGLFPSLSTIAPAGCEAFMERLLEIKNRLYEGAFQLQFSIHTTDAKLRDRLIPVPKWDFGQIAQYGARFHGGRDRRVTLNFALAINAPVEPDVLLAHFDPRHFLIKITPVNPTHRAVKNGIISLVSSGPEEVSTELTSLRSAGYDVLLSVGELEENRIGSNCGQFIQRHWERTAHRRTRSADGRGAPSMDDGGSESMGNSYACVDEADAVAAASPVRLGNPPGKVPVRE
jgi:23S rRNA (adenine2503-C2)-methyltransferase